MQTKNRFFLAIGYTLLGFILLLWPTMSIQVLCWGLGICSLVYGLFRLFNYWKVGRDNGELFKSELFLGITFSVLGLFCLISPKAVTSFLPFLLGIVLLLDAVGKLQNAIEFKNLGFPRWWMVLIASVCLFFLAITLLFNPFKAVRLTVMFFGACLFADGIADLIFYFSLRRP